MPPIVFPTSSAPGRDAIEGAGRLINAYAEPLQEGAPGTFVRRRTPGLTLFSAISASNFRGQWFDGERYLYVLNGSGLYYIDYSGTETLVSALPVGRLTFLTSAVDTSNLTTYTYSSVPFGIAHGARRIVVSVFFDDAGDYPPAAMTIGGVSATLVKAQNSAIALYIANVPTGTSGDIVVQYATAANRSAIGVWRLDGVTSNTAVATAGANGTGDFNSALMVVPKGGLSIASVNAAGTIGFFIAGDVNDATPAEDFDSSVESVARHAASSWTSPDSETIAIVGLTSGAYSYASAAWAGIENYSDIVTFAKNNAAPPDQVLCVEHMGAFTFTTSAITSIDVNGELVNSVCFGEGYFFFTTPGGLCYASGLNATTVNALDVTRAEQRAEALLRGKFFDGQLFLFGQSHIEVFASGGNPNPTGFPLNFVTAIWRGLIAPLAVCGDEEGFHPGLIFVGDDNSVHMLDGYRPVKISTPDVDRAIEACTDKSSIRMFVYHIGGHACAVVDLAGEGTWVYDLTTGFWHERDTNESGYWRATGNSVKAFGKWLCGDHDSGNIYEITEDSLTDGGEPMPFIAESIAMENFPQRLLNSRIDLNFTTGVGTAAVPDPKVKIQWSDDGGHTWSDPVTRKLGEAGRYFEQVRVNRLGLTKRKGRRYRLRVDDEVYVGLIGGSGEFTGRP